MGLCRQTDRQTGRQTDRQTDRHTQTDTQRTHLDGVEKLVVVLDQSEDNGPLQLEVDLKCFLRLPFRRVPGKRDQRERDREREKEGEREKG
jgi:hypothetical protein